MTRQSLLIFLLALFSLGFVANPQGNTWEITSSDPKLFIRWCSGTLPTVGEDDLPASDSLSGTSITLDTALESVITDYNSVPGAFYELALASTDPDYDENLHSNRIIELCFTPPGGTAGGVARTTIEDGKVVGCTIKFSESIATKATRLVSTLTHELGHCMGLGHPMETTAAIMSYYTSPDRVRLQMDDKMGLIYMYPENENLAKEDSTFGLSCAPRD